MPSETEIQFIKMWRWIDANHSTASICFAVEAYCADNLSLPHYSKLTSAWVTDRLLNSKAAGNLQLTPRGRDILDTADTIGFDPDAPPEKTEDTRVCGRCEGKGKIPLIGNFMELCPDCIKVTAAEIADAVNSTLADRLKSAEQDRAPRNPWATGEAMDAVLRHALDHGKKIEARWVGGEDLGIAEVTSVYRYDSTDDCWALRTVDNDGDKDYWYFSTLNDKHFVHLTAVRLRAPAATPEVPDEPRNENEWIAFTEDNPRALDHLIGEDVEIRRNEWNARNGRHLGVAKITEASGSWAYLDRPISGSDVLTDWGNFEVRPVQRVAPRTGSTAQEITTALAAEFQGISRRDVGRAILATTPEVPNDRADEFTQMITYRETMLTHAPDLNPPGCEDGPD